MVNDFVLNRLFTRRCFKDLIDGKVDEGIISIAAKNCGVRCQGRPNRDIIEDIYYYISRHYRNEYYYKNTLLNKLVFGKYSPNTSSALTEIPVGNAKADFILINGKAVVYEIKTELDNLERLSNQINEYYKAFRYVTVATYLQNYDVVKQHIKNHVGICIISDEGRIDQKHGRAPVEYRESLEATEIFKILRKNEFESIILSEIGDLPCCSSFDYYRECYSLIENNISLDVFQEDMEKQIKARTKIDTRLMADIPKELKNIAYFSDYRAKDYHRMNLFLNTAFGTESKEVAKCTFPF